VGRVIEEQVEPEVVQEFQLDDAKVALIDQMLSLMVWLDGRKMSDVLMPFQKQILRDFLATVRCEDRVPWYLRGLLHFAKKNAKTLLLILNTLILLHTDKPIGGKGCQIIYCANDQDQADENLDFTKKLYRANPILLDEVQIKSNMIELKNGAGYIEIVASQNADALHGRSYRLLAFDELHAQADYTVLEALELDATRPDAQQLFASYSPLTPKPGSPIVDMLRQYHDGVDPRLFVFSRSGSIEEANPAMGGPLGSTRADIEQARFRLPTWHYRRLYMNLPGQGAGSAYDAEVVERAVVAGRKVLPPQPGITYHAFVDFSAGGDDDSTLAIAHDANGKAVLDLLMDQGPRTGKTFSPEMAVKRFDDVRKLYGISKFTGDNFAKMWPQEACVKLGIEYVVSDKNRSEIYAAFEPMLNAGLVDLLDIPKLTSQFISLVRKGVKIDHPAGEHDDHANAVAGVCVLAQAPQRMPGVYVFD
jgi:Phage Terminase